MLPPLQQKQHLPPPVFQVEKEEEVEQEERVLWTSPCTPMTTKLLINSHHPKTRLKRWVFIGNPSAVFKSCWKASQEGGKLGSLLNPNFLLFYLNLPLAFLNHLYPPRLNKLTLRGEGNQMVRRQWNLEDLVLPLKKRPTGQLSSREPVMPPAEDQTGETFNCLSPKHGSQSLCSVVSP